MEPSQFHHYIPRFILRSFAHQSPARVIGSKGRKQNQKQNAANGMELLWLVDLARGPLQLIEKPLAKVFGERDLYRDMTQAVDQHRLEKQLSVLESRAGQIISDIRQAFEAGHTLVQLTRTKKDILRKFLFIMKYRGPTQSQRYRHESIDTYCADDKAKLHEYMKQKGLKRPIDVWFHNIKTILDLKMDPDGEWIKQLTTDMYPDDAAWFVIHITYSYLAICTPSEPSDEFLLSANLFSVHEGPVSLTYDAELGIDRMTAYTEYHILNVIHPKIILVLRSILLPCLGEDSNPKIAQQRREMLNISRRMHNDPSKANSILSDLPVTKASNSYSRVTINGIVFRQQHETKLKPTDVFYFKYCSISHLHVTKINAIILENIDGGPLIACKSADTLRNSLETYLAMPCTDDGEDTFSFKNVRRGTVRHEYMMKLVDLAEQLESKVKPLYCVLPSNVDDDSIICAMSEYLDVNLAELLTHFQMLYIRLGGIPDQFPNDFDQAKRIILWKVKLDLYTEGLGEAERVRIGEYLREFILELPILRVWLYMKTTRGVQLTRGGYPREIRTKDMCHGPEDVILRFKDAFRAPRLCHMIYFSAAVHTWQLMNPGQQVAGMIMSSIMDCGILAVEQRPRALVDDGLPQRLALQTTWTGIPLEVKADAILLFLVRQDFSSLMKQAGLDRHDLPDLEHVLFDILYGRPRGRNVSNLT